MAFNHLPAGVHDADSLAERLADQGYLADAGLSIAAFLALRLRRPLFLEGDAGVGKTAIAAAMAGVLDAPLIRLQCYEGIDATQALYDWNFPRQILHLRAAEAAGRHVAGDGPDPLPRHCEGPHERTPDVSRRYTLVVSPQ